MSRKTGALAFFLGAAGALASGGCDILQPGGWAAREIEQDHTFRARHPETGEVLEHGLRVTRARLNEGRRLYVRYCSACHGDDGDGKGPSSPGMQPPPRDFRPGLFKFGSVRNGELPSDADLSRIISGGLQGTAMLPWTAPEHELASIIHFIKTFRQPPCGQGVQEQESGCDGVQGDHPDGMPSRWVEVYEAGSRKGQLKPTGAPIRIAADPWAGGSAEALERGEAVYHLTAECASCHPAYVTRNKYRQLSDKHAGDKAPELRDDPYAAKVIAVNDSEYGVELTSSDFTRHQLRSIRPGSEGQDLFRVIAAGVDGTGMPDWIDALPAADLWALAHYVRSLARLRSPGQRQALRQLRAKLEGQP